MNIFNFYVCGSKYLSVLLCIFFFCKSFAELPIYNYSQLPVFSSGGIYLKPSAGSNTLNPFTDGSHGLFLSIDDRFHETFKNQLVQATQLMLNRVLEKRIIDCTEAHYQGHPDEIQTLKFRLLFSLSLIPLNNGFITPPFLLITDINSPHMGMAFLNYFYQKSEFELYFRDFNSRFYIGVDSNNHKKYPLEELADTIIHEMLHNLGFSHSNPTNYSDLVYTFSKCLKNNGY